MVLKSYSVGAGDCGTGVVKVVMVIIKMLGEFSLSHLFPILVSHLLLPDSQHRYLWLVILLCISQILIGI